MVSVKSRKTKPLLYTALVVLLLGGFFFLLRGPYLSNSIKRIIIPVLENATRERIIIDSAVINPFPFYIQAKGLKVFDRDGNRLLWVTKTRAYMDLFGLLSRDINIRKLTVKEPDLNADEDTLKRVWDNIKASASGERDMEYEISLKNIQLTEGKFNFTGKDGLNVSGDDVFLEMNTKNRVFTDFRIGEVALGLPSSSEILKGGLSGKIKIKDDGIEVAEMEVRSSGSSLQAKGIVHLEKGSIRDGSFSGSAEIHADTLRNLLGLKTEKEGVFAFDGSVGITMDGASQTPRFSVDLNTDSRFYIETLMEILKVEENITGSLSLNGRITGTFPELTGEGKVELKDAVIDTFPLDDASGRITYGDKKFTLNDFTAHTYNGELKGDASLVVPQGDYEVTAGVSGVGSPEFFKFIEWAPPFPKGEIGGRFRLRQNQGQGMEIAAGLNYLNTSAPDGDVFGRLHTIKANIHLKDDILRFDNSVLSTQASSLFLDGNVDFAKETIGLNLVLESSDVGDLTAPHYTRLVAPARFKGKATGPIDGPMIAGSLEMGPGSVHGLAFTAASSDLIYKIRSLAVSRLRVKHDKTSYDASGVIEFRNAKELFTFTGPFYKAKLSAKDADIKPLVRALYKDVPVSGHATGSISFEGDPKNFSAAGEFVFRDSVAYGQQFDAVKIKTTLQPGSMEFHSITAERGGSVLTGRGSLSSGGKFTLIASSQKVDTRDINLLGKYPFDASFGLNVSGSGAIERPDIKFSLKILESSFGGMQTGKGSISGRLKEKDLSAAGTFFNGIVTADAKATLTGKVPWSADVSLHRGEYDFLLAKFMKDVPKDLALSLEGNIGIKGEGGGKVSLSTRLHSVDFTLYGYNFRNTDDVVLDFADGGFAIKSFSLAGDSAELTAEGVLKLNDRFDVKVKGNMNVAPLRAFSDKIASLRGRSSFNINIAGPWETPDVTGDVKVVDVIASLKEYPYKAGPLNGTFFLKKDRIVFDSVRTGFGGGVIEVSGVGYLKRLSVKRLFISSIVTGVNIRPMEKVSATVDGRLFYERSAAGSTLSGNLDIKKARYEKAVEWNRWILGLRDLNNDTARYPAFLKETEFNVHVSGTDNIVIDNNIAKTQVKMALTFTGNVSRPGLVGRIEASEGVIYFRGNEFKLLEGSSVDFADPNRITPVFHILAETYSGEYYVKLHLDGTIDKFSMSLFSDPPLSEMEILTLLTFGQAGRDARGIEGGIAAGEAASVLTEGLQDVVQEKFRSITGFEQFRVEPHVTSAGAVSPRVTIGKRLLEDKLFVIYSTSLGTTEENIIKLEYRLDRNISIVGSRDEIGSVGGDLKYRFEFK
ncbi:MAG: hypothetical protein C4560_02015 [Nitrospiraceae bacterium]|nr:MAG: hypothetical protein C4560_02015 [Nitrospiraceae bacterium]